VRDEKMLEKLVTHNVQNVSELFSLADKCARAAEGYAWHSQPTLEAGKASKPKADVVAQSSVSHLMPFGCKCFVLKCGNLDKFESHSSDGILLDYTPHGRSYRMFNLETNTVIELFDVTFDEGTFCPRDVFECASDKEMEENIFIDEELYGIMMKIIHSVPLHHHPSLFLLPHLKQMLLMLLPPPQEQWKRHGLRGRSSLSRVPSFTFRRHIQLNRS
jgi:hypothetical protein